MYRNKMISMYRIALIYSIENNSGTHRSKKKCLEQAGIC